MAIKPDLLLRIQAIISDAHNAFIANFIGPSAVPTDVLERLRRLGKLRPQAQMIVDAYLVGRVQAQLGPAPGPGKPGQPAAGTPPTSGPKQPYLAGKPSTGTPVPKGADGKEMGYEQVREYLAANPIPLSQAETDAIQLNQLRAAQFLRGLGNRVEAQTGALLIQADAKQDAAYRQVVTDLVSRNIAERKTVRQLKSDLGHATGDWSRDLDRIAITEKQAALQAGVAKGIEDRHGADARVLKQPGRGACKYCRQAYLHPDGTPKVFKLSELMANGTNVGRKARDWLPTVDPLHPWCLCALAYLPAGMEPTADGRLVATKSMPDPMRLPSQSPEGTLRKATAARPRVRLRVRPRA